jgi:hypothetical protein
MKRAINGANQLREPDERFEHDFGMDTYPKMDSEYFRGLSRIDGHVSHVK